MQGCIVCCDTADSNKNLILQYEGLAMGFDFLNFDGGNLSGDYIDWLVDDQWVDIGIHFGRLWEYYHNRMHDVTTVGEAGQKRNESSRNYVQGQEYGLPARITGLSYSGAGGMFTAGRAGDIQRKEVVIENDITWRINAMVDFLFGKGVEIVSKSPSVGKRREIERIIKTVFAANGGIGFFQDMAVLGSVYGFVDCIIRPGREVLVKNHRFSKTDGNAVGTSNSPHNSSFESLLKLVSGIGLELIEAPRALPVLDEDDYRKIQYYVQNFYQQKNSVSSGGGIFSQALTGKGRDVKRDVGMLTEVIGKGKWQRYENKELVGEGVNPLGIVPVVHIQNVAQPYYYEGISDVEQLIGLQDELNTRLSDRANRITFQAFKMFLAKGIEGIDNKPVSPGRMWCTDNIDASIEQFGGDSESPSESRHITEIREAMDKISGVTPVVAGVLKNKLGNLTSGVALKMTFMGMLAKTSRKQFTYGQGLKQIVQMVLHTLDVCGVYSTTPDDREIEVVWPNPLPEDVFDRLREAQMKKELGVSQEDVLRELGY